MVKRRLLILGPSFRRKKDGSLLPAFERFDGLFYRVTRKYLGEAGNVEIVVMKDDLTLIDGEAPLAYDPPKGENWTQQPFSERDVEEGKRRNEFFLRDKLKRGRYSEVFVAMGRRYASALPSFSKYNVKVVFPTSGGPGPKAGALRDWLREA